MLFTDTDSFTYQTKFKDVNEEFFKHKHLSDFSNFLKNKTFFDEANKKVIGKMKDVSEGKINDEFVGLKSKMRSMKNNDDKETNTAKGVSVATEFKKLRRIQAKNHKLETYEINKISLSCFDD